ncbi:MAG TPA: hypothetical protein VIL20_21525, partial [Sandaracinaceae bacterium]
MDRRLLRSALACAMVALVVAAGGAIAQEAPLGAAAGETGAPLVDATLESVRGGRRTLRDERGRRVVVLFYEDRPHIED